MTNLENLNQDENTNSENAKTINFDYLDKKIDGGQLLNSHWAKEIKETGYNIETRSLLDPEFQKLLARDIIEVSEFKGAGFPMPMQSAPGMSGLDEQLSPGSNFFIYLSQKYPESFPVPINAKAEEDTLSSTRKSMDTRLYESWLRELTMLIQEAYANYEDPKLNDFIETLSNRC